MHSFIGNAGPALSKIDFSKKFVSISIRNTGQIRLNDAVCFFYTVSSKEIDMKKTVFLLLSFISVLFPACESVENYSSSSTKAQTETEISTEDPEIQQMAALTNEFRTGNEAFYLNSDNRTTTSHVGKLGTLRLDSDLCRAAAIRAKETATSFSHTRPDGRSCFSVAEDLSISYSYIGENIAAGNETAQGTFLQWKEDDKPYSGQGHRRNMLKPEFTRIGIARYYKPNDPDRYNYYWVMILAR